jgi:hypothetical protein
MSEQRPGREVAPVSPAKVHLAMRAVARLDDVLIGALDISTPSNLCFAVPSFRLDTAMAARSLTGGRYAPSLHELGPTECTRPSSRVVLREVADPDRRRHGRILPRPVLAVRTLPANHVRHHGDR